MWGTFLCTIDLAEQGCKLVHGEVGKRDVLGVERVGPAELVGDLPGDALEDRVAEQSNLKSAHIGELSPAHRSVQQSDRSCERSSVGATSWCPGAITACSCASRRATSGPITYLGMESPHHSVRCSPPSSHTLDSVAAEMPCRSSGSRIAVASSARAEKRREARERPRQGIDKRCVVAKGLVLQPQPEDHG